MSPWIWSVIAVSCAFAAGILLCRLCEAVRRLERLDDEIARLEEIRTEPRM